MSDSKENEITPIPREWLTVEEACEYSRVSRAVLYGWINDGELPSFSNKKAGEIKGRRLISLNALREFLEAGSTGGKGGE